MICYDFFNISSNLFNVSCNKFFYIGIPNQPCESCVSISYLRIMNISIFDSYISTCDRHSYETVTLSKYVAKYEYMR